MAEIKTAEHYVLVKLQELEDEVKEQDEELGRLHEELGRLHEALANYAEIVKDLRVQETYDHTGYFIDLNSVWEKYDKKRFDWYIKTFNLCLPEHTAVSKEGK